MHDDAQDCLSQVVHPVLMFAAAKRPPLQSLASDRLDLHIVYTRQAYYG